MNDDRYHQLSKQQRRDRQLAGEPHYGPRKAAKVSDLVSQWMKSPQVRRLKKYSHLTVALEEVLAPALLQRVSPKRWSGNVLTLAVAGSPHLAEIRQFYQTALLDAFMRHGLGIAQLRLEAVSKLTQVR